MRRFLFLLLIFNAITYTSSATNYITKKDFRIFDTKTVKVVLRDNNSLSDLVLKDAMQRNWNICAFEFCNLSEFERSKSDTSLFFLMCVSEAKEAQQQAFGEYIELLKPTKDSEQDINEMKVLFKYILNPLPGDSFNSVAFIPLYIKAMQHNIKQCISEEKWFLLSYENIDNKSALSGEKLIISKDDLSHKTDIATLETKLGNNLSIVDFDIIDKAISEADNIVISRSVDVRVGNDIYNYKTLINAQSGKIYLYKKRKLIFGMVSGFSDKEILSFSKMAQKKAQ